VMQEDRACALICSMKKKLRVGSNRNCAVSPPPRWALSAAEVRVVQSLASGLRPSEIGDSLGLSVHTIRTHLKRAMVKAGVHSQTALVVRVYSSGS
jgi:DNA-binding CsgD family transcriptional regulator